MGTTGERRRGEMEIILIVLDMVGSNTWNQVVVETVFKTAILRRARVIWPTETTTTIHHEYGVTYISN